MEKMKKKEVTYAYTDSFFEEGHYLLKIKQTFYALFGWFFLSYQHLSLSVVTYSLCHSINLVGEFGVIKKGSN